jgi:uncharacterized lipoprotein NlpE involved in copper resistance
MRNIKKIISTIICLSLTLTFILSGCNNKNKIKEETDNDWQIAPTFEESNGIVAVTSDMNALTMFKTAIGNLNKIDQYVVDLKGKVDTNVSGLKVVQDVATFKIMDNKNKKYYVNTASMGNDQSTGALKQAVKVLEDTYIDSDGKLYFRNSKSGNISVSSEGKIVTSEWNSVETYDSKESYVEAKKNDPTIFGMYTINENTIKADECSVTDNDGYYTISLVFDPVLATPDYVKVMKYMIGSMASADDAIVFQRLKIDFEIWDSGLIRRQIVDEAYNMNIKVAILTIKGDVALYNTTYYTYNNSKYDVTSYKFN